MHPRVYPRCVCSRTLLTGLALRHLAIFLPPLNFSSPSLSFSCPRCPSCRHSRSADSSFYSFCSILFFSSSLSSFRPWTLTQYLPPLVISRRSQFRPSFSFLSFSFLIFPVREAGSDRLSTAHQSGALQFSLPCCRPPILSFLSLSPTISRE